MKLTELYAAHRQTGTTIWDVLLPQNHNYEHVPDKLILGLNVHRDRIRSIEDGETGGGVGVGGRVPMNSSSQTLRPAKTEETVSHRQ